jgi:5-(carboxyamino)imidazole ribonucleotide mutase
MKFVSIIIGSNSDFDVMKKCTETFEKFNVNYELTVLSLYDSIEKIKDYIKSAEEKGAVSFIVASSINGCLASSVASGTTKPIIAVPLKDKNFDGSTAILSTINKPLAMPVATVALDEEGAINSAYLAVQILALNDNELAVKLKEDRIVMLNKVQTAAKNIEVLL